MRVAPGDEELVKRLLQELIKEDREERTMEPVQEVKMRSPNKPDPKRQGIAIGVLMMAALFAACAIGAGIGAFLVRVLAM